jgi:hypothetical protein
MLPGDQLTFSEVTVVEAHRLLAARERDFRRIKGELSRRVS